MKLIGSLPWIFADLGRFLGYAWKNWKIKRANPGSTIAFPVVWQYDRLDAIKLGTEVYIGPFGEIVVLTNSHFSRVPGSLTIGERAVVGASCNIRAAGGSIVIGKNAQLAQGVSLVASGHKVQLGRIYRDEPWRDDKTGVEIGNNCWIGAGVTVLPGCCVGDNSVVGAGSVVTKSIPQNEIWANVPARRIGSIPVD